MNGEEIHTIKPLLDKAPAQAWLVASRRIDELCEAIKSYSAKQIVLNTENIRIWAHEIIAQCDLIDEMEGD